jgi:hypothetical protein
MTQEFLNALNIYTKTVKLELPDQDEKAVPTIARLLTLIEYMQKELAREHG